MAERPFDEREERFFLAEILKDAPIPPSYLLHCILQLQIRPRWNDIALPYGRSANACERAFNNLRNRTPTDYLAATEQVSAPAAAVRLKKRTSAGGLSTPAQTASAPYSSFPSVNDPSSPYAPMTTSQSPSGKPQKKRGRPNKAEAELRAAEAAERGEVYPKPKKVKAKPSIEGGVAPLTGIMSPVEEAGALAVRAGAPPTVASAEAGGLALPGDVTSTILSAEDRGAAAPGGAPQTGSSGETGGLAAPGDAQSIIASPEPGSGKRTPQYTASEEARTNLEATASAVESSGGKSVGSGTQNLLAGIQEHATQSETLATKDLPPTVPPQRSEEPPRSQQPEQEPVSKQSTSSAVEAEPYQTPYQ